jgi:penicillin-binding protein 2
VFVDGTGKYAYSSECDISIPADQTNCYQQNAGAVPSGSVDLQQALTESSDTYFYRIGDHSWRARDDIGGEAMQESMRRWGLGSETGIDLPAERPGRIPTPNWLLAFSAEINAGDPEAIEERGRWQAGSSGNMMVGQGDVIATPLQLANGYAALANGGTLWLPQLVLQTTDYASDSNVRVMEQQPIGQVEMPGEWRDTMLRGFDGVTKSGTAATVFNGFDQAACAVSGKTGTAEVNNKNDTSLFTAYAPTPFDGRESTIAMATVFEEAGFGAAVAAPLTRRVLEPFAAAGCDLQRFAESAPQAPLGGWFDVEVAQEEFVPPTEVSND